MNDLEPDRAGLKEAQEIVAVAAKAVADGEPGSADMFRRAKKCEEGWQAHLDKRSRGPAGAVERMKKMVSVSPLEVRLHDSA